MTLSSRIKQKTTKNSKSKKKNNSYHKIAECKSNKNSHQRSPNMYYEVQPKPTIATNMAVLGNIRHQSQLSDPVKMKLSSSHTKGADSFNQTRGNSKERTGLSQERIIKRETGKRHIVDFIGKYIKQNNEIEIDREYDETLDNLKDFLGYLEDKQIINGQQLEDREEVNNLIRDLMKLDLSKFHNLRKSMERKKKGSRNVNVSVNRSNSVKQHHNDQQQNADNAGRKTHSVTSKNIYRA